MFAKEDTTDKVIVLEHFTGEPIELKPMMDADTGEAVMVEARTRGEAAVDEDDSRTSTLPGQEDVAPTTTEQTLPLRPRHTDGRGPAVAKKTALSQRPKSKLKALPLTTPIVVRSPNPKTKTYRGAVSESYERYNKYMGATTIGEYLKAGGTYQDLAWDYDRSYVQLPEVEMLKRSLANLVPDVIVSKAMRRMQERLRRP